MSLHKQMHVIGHDLQREHTPIVLIALHPNQLISPDCDVTGKHLATVLRAPDNVIAKVVRTTGTSSKHTLHNDECTPEAQLMRQCNPIHPSPKDDSPLGRI